MFAQSKLVVIDPAAVEDDLVILNLVSLQGFRLKRGAEIHLMVDVEWGYEEDSGLKISFLFYRLHGDNEYWADLNFDPFIPDPNDLEKNIMVPMASLFNTDHENNAFVAMIIHSLKGPVLLALEHDSVVTTISLGVTSLRVSIPWKEMTSFFAIV